MADTTNAFTANAATQPNVLPLRGLQLIGIAGPEDAPRALFRAPGGTIHTGERGATVRQATIIAIGADHVILRTGTRTLRLAMPGAANAPAA